MAKAPFKRCLFFLADGARPDILEQEMAKGNLPHMVNYMASHGTCRAMTTVFPSTTGPAYLPYLTGCYPGTCNVPGIRWFDKDHYAKKGWSLKSFRSYVGLETFLMNYDLKPQVKTAFDIFEKSYSIFNMLNRGIHKNHNLTRLSRIWYIYYAHLTDRWAYVDKASTTKLIEAIHRDPEFVFVVYPAIDEYSHRSSPFHTRTIEAYHELDTHIGEVIAVLKQKGWLDDTLLVLASDHGLSETKRHFDIGPHLETKGIKTFFYTQIFKFRFDAASMVSGNGMVHLYFKGEKGWQGRCSIEEIASKGLLLDELRLRPEVDLIAGQATDGAIHLFSDKGHGWYRRVGVRFEYQWIHGDPLGIFKELSKSILLTEDDSYLQTIKSHFPDVFVQLEQVFKSPRCGDLVISARSGSDLRERYEHPEHKASHGSLCHEHMLVPLLMNYPVTQPVVRSVDVFPTILSLMGKEIPSGIDGKTLI